MFRDVYGTCSRLFGVVRDFGGSVDSSWGALAARTLGESKGCILSFLLGTAQSPKLQAFLLHQPLRDAFFDGRSAASIETWEWGLVMLVSCLKKILPSKHQGLFRIGTGVTHHGCRSSVRRRLPDTSQACASSSPTASLCLAGET